ncbi:hypothetical protein CRYUN_Cryun35bG0061200 [Craigia yunnanensis]
MGAILSLVAPRNSINDYNEVLKSETCKKQKKLSCFDEDSSRLIPRLPDELSMFVSQNWRATVMSPLLYKFRKELGMTEEWLTKVKEEKPLYHALDPLSRKWQKLPSIPSFFCEEEYRKSLWNMVGPSIKIAEFIRGWRGHKGGSDHTPFCGCAVGAVDGCLYMLGGFYRASTMKIVWRFDPILNAWSEMASMSIGRVYCKTSILNNKLYVVGGVSRGQGGLTHLQSAEVFDPHTGTWSQVPSMPCSRAQMLPNAFLADMLKPIATGMTSYMGRLCVAQSLYSWPFFFDVGGEIYDPETNSWSDMPNGMGEGWPARQAGTKLSVVLDGELYGCDPSGSFDSESPYLLAGFHGRLHVITKDANRDISVIQADPQDNFSPLSSNSTSLSSGSLHEFPDSLAESEKVNWKVIATTDFGSADLSVVRS